MYNLKNKISMARSIVHMDMDTFFVSCERLTNSKLIGLPLIIGGDRGVVASCSYEARTFGVRSAMPIKIRLCPQAKGWRWKFYYPIKVIGAHCRKASIDEFYLDITGMDRFHGCYQWTNELSQSITKKQDCR
jgi:DNA polymerase-4